MGKQFCWHCMRMSHG
uniref:Uncharacterized protein n=1 Tax=Arundo donax TaxID=35708 RepID=A0A0A9E9E8_ARUDO